ncbi:MAG: hypothetical protein EOR01_17450 [Mesorhizobium sp.]|uniref:hypothetical protein n=1 Tax=Mesorhizobium sp. TaxID=1871066 RepID=UPI000FE4E051|nr:hypothetical protein [Mesorhizobium sp.]RWP21019.1 MAG: hypothetical protein EOR01_17450 [Mesorhizobium sp.]
MPDLIPEGHISVYSAFGSFELALWSGHSPTAELSNDNIYRGAPCAAADRFRVSRGRVEHLVVVEFLNAFKSGYLEAFVRPPNAVLNFVVPAESWSAAAFPEKAFERPEIVYRHGGYWDELVGRTLFVRKTQFDSWLAARTEARNDLNGCSSPATQALVDHLLELAACGLVPSSEIEDVGKQWGLPAFASTPAPRDHEPLNLPGWTLCMAVSWIVWRDIDCVREVMDTFRSASLRWVACTRLLACNGGKESVEVNGETLESPKPINLSTLELIEHEGKHPPKLMSAKSAREQLWLGLAEGKLDASGVNSEGAVSWIGKHEWSRLELAADRQLHDYVVSSNDRSRPAYTEIAVCQASLLQNWSNPGLLKSACPLPYPDAALPIRPRRGKLQATRQAIAALYPDGLPSGLTAKERLDQVNSWHRRQGNSQVALTTVLRAISAS